MNISLSKKQNQNNNKNKKQSIIKKIVKAKDFE